MPPRRRAPSAGALFPIEVVAVHRAAEQWATYVYDFRAHRFAPLALDALTGRPPPRFLLRRGAR